MDAANLRLSTLDGEESQVANLGETMGPSTNPEDAKAEEPKDTAPLDTGLDTTRAGPSYFIVRNGKLKGPMPFSRISERASKGELELDDRIQDRTTGVEHPVASIPVLRRLLETAEDRKELLRFSQQRAAPRSGPAPAPPPKAPKDRRNLVTLVWVVAALGVFAGAAWWLMNR